MRRRARTNWYALRDEIETALGAAEGFSSSVQIDGRLNHLGTGLSHDNYIFHIRSVGATPFPKECAYVLRQVRDESVEVDGERAFARLRNEARTLQALASHELDFTVPRFVCLVGDHGDGPTGFIETAVPGIPCDWLKRDPGQSKTVRGSGRTGAFARPPGGKQRRGLGILYQGLKSLATNVRSPGEVQKARWTVRRRAVGLAEDSSWAS